MIKKHEKDLNANYHVYDEDEQNQHSSPAVLRMKPRPENMPLTPPELRKDIIVDDVDKYADKVKFEQHRDERL